MKKSEILREARHLVEEDTFTFICLALRHARNKKVGTNDTTTNKNLAGLLQYIEESLEGCPTLERWLSVKHGLSVDEFSTEKLRQTRLNWIDWMIEQLEEQGK